LHHFIIRLKRYLDWIVKKLNRRYSKDLIYELLKDLKKGVIKKDKMMSDTQIIGINIVDIADYNSIWIQFKLSLN